MSRYQSIYATNQKRPARWPWFLAALLVIVLSGATGAMIAQGETPRSLLAKLDSPTSTPMTSSAAVVAETPEPTSTSTAVPEPTEPAPEPTVEPSREPTAQPVASSAEPTAQEATPEPDPAEVDRTSPVDVVTAYAERWSTGDYGGMWDLLSTDVQTVTPKQDFVDRLTAIAAEAGLTTITVEIAGQADLQARVPVDVTFESSRVGAISESNLIPLQKEGDDWRIAWTPSLIFKDLGDGCIDFSIETVNRGSILDRDGDPLAYDGAINVVGIIPGLLEDEKDTITKLSKLIGMPVKDIEEKYSKGEADWFMPIKTYPADLDQSVMTGIGQLKGVAVRSEAARVYPLGAAAAHITGYVTRVTAEDIAADPTGSLADGDWVGRAGLEAGANELLTGKPGGRLAIVDCDSRVERKLLRSRTPVPPKDIVLTVDKDFQISVDKALGDVQGSAVILDPRTGAVLAMASHPSFDPNWFVVGFTDKDWAFVNDEKKRPLLNRATEAGYPTGSIFKVITMAAGMEGLGYTGETQIDCPQQWSIPGTDQIWRDWTEEEGLAAQGMLTLHWALVNSCNTVFYQIGAALDEKDESFLPDMAKGFGLGSPTGIPYLAEIAGIVPDPAWKREILNDFWARGDAVNLSIGQGYLEATPLQMANAYAAIANNGSLLQPFIVEFTQDSDGVLKRIGKRTPLHKLPVDRDNLAEIQAAMRDQTSNAAGAGSYRVFGDFQYPIAGKTGTAQNQMTVSQKPHSWFASFGPYGEKATIASIVMVESSGEGVSFAAPRTRAIYEAYLKTDLAAEPESS